MRAVACPETIPLRAFAGCGVVERSVEDSGGMGEIDGELGRLVIARARRTAGRERGCIGGDIKQGYSRVDTG